MPPIPQHDLLGYAASLAVLATFYMKTMGSLRAVAIASNILFVAYGYSEHIVPVLLLHLVLLPINTVRLFAMLQR
jgi:hypothetical protein